MIVQDALHRNFWSFVFLRRCGTSLRSSESVRMVTAQNLGFGFFFVLVCFFSLSPTPTKMAH